MAGDKMILIIDSDTTLIQDSGEIQQLLDQKIRKKANQGYPFAEAILSSYRSEKEQSYLNYRIDPKGLVVIDSIVYGDFSASERAMIHFYAGKPHHGIFRLNQLEQARFSLEQLGHLITLGESRIHENTLYIPVLPREQIEINGLLNYKKEDKIEIVGNIDFKLENFTALGRRLHFHWHHPDEKSHDIGMTGGVSFPFSLPMEMEISFQQHFRDSLYILRHYNVTGDYYLGKNIKFGIHYSSEAVSANQSENELNYQLENYQSSGLQLSFNKYRQQNSQYFDLRYGLKSSILRKIHYTDMQAGFELQRKKYILSLYSRGALLSSKEDIPDYFKIRFGNADFLRAEDYDQHQSTSYFGSGIEIGPKSKFGGIILFSEAAWLFDQHKEIYNFGFKLNLNTNNSKVTVILAFNPDYPWSRGKLYLVWGG